jgi:hypothetical protein
MPIKASRVVNSSQADVFAFLSDIRNHWPLASSLVSIDDVSDDGGHIVVQGPFGVKRQAHTSLTRVESAQGLVEGIAEDAEGTLAVITWRTNPVLEISRVGLEVDLRRRGPRDRLLLLFGGRLWLWWCLRRTLGNLERALQRR